MERLIQILKYASIVLLVLASIGAIWWAFGMGKKAAQGRQVVKDAKTIVSALEYFYKDQNRYPAITEFQDQNIMRQYMSGFPPQEFLSSSCAKSFDYTNTYRDDYELRFCLPKGVKGYRTGWNVIKSPVK